ncbi:hypothetical protein GPX89_32405 [Nocardia sp. ET3-3]|uniref:Uncharacterized protein n=1 Tax=Nocardia terrae TaxID=2675851 RepID=A0A7K1V743_9NOCA|nr:hypothetical protein [Nocardia terrae]MVU81928.1 hypothetical protein [Nocardia terrae]
MTKYMLDDLDPDEPRWEEHYSSLRQGLDANFSMGAITGVNFGDDDVLAEVERAYNALVAERAFAPSVRHTDEQLAAGIARAQELIDGHCGAPDCESWCHRLRGRIGLLTALQRVRANPKGE